MARKAAVTPVVGLEDITWNYFGHSFALDITNDAFMNGLGEKAEELRAVAAVDTEGKTEDEVAAEIIARTCRFFDGFYGPGTGDALFGTTRSVFFCCNALNSFAAHLNALTKKMNAVRAAMDATPAQKAAK